MEEDASGSMCLVSSSGVSCTQRNYAEEAELAFIITVVAAGLGLEWTYGCVDLACEAPSGYSWQGGRAYYTRTSVGQDWPRLATQQ